MEFGKATHDMIEVFWIRKITIGGNGNIIQ